MLPLDEKFAGVSLGGDDFIKQLDHFAMLKGMGKPTYKIIPRMSNGKPYYSCSVKVSTDLHFVSEQWLKCMFHKHH
jgi:hypothetical protein